MSCTSCAASSASRRSSCGRSRCSGPSGAAPATTRRSPCAWATGRRPRASTPASGASTCAGAATSAWARTRDDLVFTDAQGAPLDAGGLDRYLRLARSRADQPAVEHRVLHRPARRALRRRARRGGLAAEGGGGMKAALLPAYDAELSIENVAAARDHRGLGRDREGRRRGSLPHRPPHHRGDLAGEGQRRAPSSSATRTPGWVEDGGRPASRRSSRATQVIVHPVITCGPARPAGAGEEMHCSRPRLPGHHAERGSAEYLHTGNGRYQAARGAGAEGDRAYADAGSRPTARRKRAAERLTPGRAAR